MSPHLCISVTFLDPLFHGRGDGGDPEWPPSPMRLFQALLAGARTGCRNRDWSDAKARAFEWLERRDPPEIIAPEVHGASAYTLFVPNNDSDKTFNRQERLTPKVVHPNHLTNGQTIHYLWPIDDDEWSAAQPHVETLCAEARNLLALGWGIDQVVGDGQIVKAAQATTLRGVCWKPWRGFRSADRRLRIPRQGTLRDLEKEEARFRQRVHPEGQVRHTRKRLHVFRSVIYLRASAIPPRPYVPFELPEGVAFRQEDAVKVAAMLRSLACRRAKEDTHEFPGGSKMYVAGHTRDDPALKNGRTPPRFSYLPLPTIGHAHADGMISRVLIAEPVGGNGLHTGWAQQRLRNQALRDNARNERGVLLNPWRRTSEAMIRRYVAETRIWSSVTPVILPGFDDGKRTKADKLFLLAAQQAGLPMGSIEEFTLRKAPFWPRSVHPRQYHRPDYLKNRPAWHAWFCFREPIHGPISLGAGRHCGLGLFAAADDT